jgi:GlpG protein
MLQLTEFDSKKQANRFSNFLRSEGIPNGVQQHDAKFELWIERNEHLDVSQTHLQAFLQNPNDAKYQVKIVDNRRAKRRELKARYKRNFSRNYANNYISISLVVMAVLFFILAKYVGYRLIDHFSLVDRGAVLDYQFESILDRQSVLTLWQIFLNFILKQPWRLLTPMFIHWNIIHLMFNGYWVYYLGGLIEKKERSWFFIVMILSAALVTNVAQFVVDYAQPSAGLSGVVYAFFAYLWLSAKYNPMSGYWIRQDIVVWMVGWFLIGLSGYFGYVGHYSYLGGLLVGALFAYVKSSKSFRYKR